MKSVVVEIKDGFAAVLSDDGSIVKIKNKNYSMGDEIIMKNQKLHITKKLALSIASLVLILLAGGTGTWAYYSPYSYVSLDVNPSIEYILNRFNRVIKVESVNEDGQAILDHISTLNNLTITAAISETVTELEQEGYFANETSLIGTSSDTNLIPSDETDANTTDTLETLGGGIVIAISAENDDISESLAEQLRETVENIVEDDVEIEVSLVGLERVQEAKALGVTPGKLNLVEKLIASSSNSDEIILEEWLNKSVKEIMKEIYNNANIDAAELQGEDAQVEANFTDDPDSDESDFETTDSKKDSDQDDDNDKDDNTNSQRQTSTGVNNSQKETETKREKDKNDQEEAKHNAEVEQERIEKEQKEAEHNAEVEQERIEKDQEEANHNAEVEQERAEKDQEEAEHNAEQERERAEKEQEEADEKISEQKEDSQSDDDSYDNKDHDSDKNQDREDD